MMKMFKHKYTCNKPNISTMWNPQYKNLLKLHQLSMLQLNHVSLLDLNNVTVEIDSTQIREKWI